MPNALLLFACSRILADDPTVASVPDLDDWGPRPVATYEGSTGSWGPEFGVHSWHQTTQDSGTLHQYRTSGRPFGRSMDRRPTALTRVSECSPNWSGGPPRREGRVAARPSIEFVVSASLAVETDQCGWINKR
jgi:hypothetical protein